MQTEIKEILEVVYQHLPTYTYQGKLLDGDLRYDYGLDSVKILELCMDMEITFDTCIPMGEIWRWHTPQDVANTIDKLIN